MSWLDIFKRKPAANLHTTHTGSLYTAEEVAEAGVDDDQVHYPGYGTAADCYGRFYI